MGRGRPAPAAGHPPLCETPAHVVPKRSRCHVASHHRAGFGRAGRAANPGSPEPTRSRPDGHARRWGTDLKSVPVKSAPFLGVIGGSGLYEMEGPTRVTRVRLCTPFGPPSDEIAVGDLENVRVAFLARHGRGHRLSPSEINYRANIYALKKLGVERVVSVSAVGSMKEALQPGHVVIPNQFYDQTKRRIGTFFEGGLVAHVALADPVCRDEAGKLAEAARKCGATVHEGGVYLCIEGPQFSTRGESLIYRQWGVDVIGMTNLPEAKLAREAQLCYATLALVTDYDCWHPGHDAVTVDAIIETLHRNVALSRQIIQTVAPALTGDRPCSCARALETAVLTPRHQVPAATRKRLSLLLGPSVEPKKGA